MNYQELTAIKLPDVLNQEALNEVLKQYQLLPVTVRMFPTLGEIWLGFESLTLQQKEQCLRQAVEQGLNPEVVLKDSNGGECPYPFPIKDGQHPILGVNAEESLMFLRFDQKRTQVCLREIYPHDVLQWIFQLLEQLKIRAEEELGQAKEQAIQTLIQSCERLKEDESSISEKIKQLTTRLEKINQECRKYQRPLQEASLLLYRVSHPNQRPIHGVAGYGTTVGILHFILILFVSISEVPMLQAFIIQQLKKEELKA